MSRLLAPFSLLILSSFVGSVGMDVTSRKIKGRKQRWLIDTLGLLVAVLFTGVNVDNGTAAQHLPERIAMGQSARLPAICCANKCRILARSAGFVGHRPFGKVEIQSRPDGAAKLEPVQQRCLVEPNNASTVRCQRSVKNDEQRVESCVVAIQLSNIRVILRRLAPTARPPFNDPTVAYAAKIFGNFSHLLGSHSRCFP